MRRSDIAGKAAALALRAATAALLAWPALAEPARVVSINLCTDQLAMLLADPGQLVSVTHLAADPLMSSMVAEAAAYPVNRGQAEQVFLLGPDLVLAGTYTQAATVDLLRGLGVEVLQVPPVTSLAEAAEQLRVVGAALGQAARGQAMAQAFEAEVAALSVQGAKQGAKATAAFYYPNGYTTGRGTLSDEVLERTGFSNIGATAGVTGGGILPLERLVVADPAVVVTASPYPGASRSEEILQHPALLALRGDTGAQTDADWVCGTPHLLRAMRRMAALRTTLRGAP